MGYRRELKSNHFLSLHNGSSLPKCLFLNANLLSLTLLELNHISAINGLHFLSIETTLQYTSFLLFACFAYLGYRDWTTTEGGVNLGSVLVDCDLQWEISQCEHQHRA